MKNLKNFEQFITESKIQQIEAKTKQLQKLQEEKKELSNNSKETDIPALNVTISD